MTRIYIGIALALAVLFGIWHYGNEREADGEAKIMQAWEHSQTIALAARQSRIDANRRASDALQDSADKRRAQDAKRLADLYDVVVAMRSQLLDRASRADPRAGESDPTACARPDGTERTGAGLYREDADFLIGASAESAFAARQRDTCYILYEQARQKLKESKQ